MGPTTEPAERAFGLGPEPYLTAAAAYLADGRAAAAAKALAAADIAARGAPGPRWWELVVQLDGLATDYRPGDRVVVQINGAATPAVVMAAGLGCLTVARIGGDGRPLGAPISVPLAYVGGYDCRGSQWPEGDDDGA